MATESPNTQKKKNNNSSLPPKRGQIKAQIFESFVETVTFAASKAGEALGVMIKRGGGGGGEGEASINGGSTFTSPPPGAYPSHG